MEAPPPGDVTRSPRRRFLEALSTTLLAIPIVGPLLLSLRVAITPGRTEGGGDVATLPLQSLADDAITPFRIRFTRRRGAYREEVDRLVYLRRKGNAVIALSPECTHLGCNVRYRVAERDLWCPCHKGRFDLDGNRLEGPPPLPLRRYPVLMPDDPTKPIRLQV
jgi:menaquinol-cytochrome c reductase iron-sulfur subunit